MPRIYLTYRPEDSTRHEVERIYERMAARYGADNILRTAAGGNADALYLTRLVKGCDALIVVIGRYWLNLLGEDGKRLIDDPHDYQRIELMTALAREDMWVTVVFTDEAHIPLQENLPKAIQDLLRRDRLIAPTIDVLDKELDSLEERIGMAGADRPISLAKPQPATIVHKESPPLAPVAPEKSPNADARKKMGMADVIGFIVAIIILLVYMANGGRLRR